jgi:hypothetical protein
MLDFIRRAKRAGIALLEAANRNVLNGPIAVRGSCILLLHPLPCFLLLFSPREPAVRTFSPRNNRWLPRSQGHGRS